MIAWCYGMEYYRRSAYEANFSFIFLVFNSRVLALCQILALCIRGIFGQATTKGATTTAKARRRV